MLAYPAADMSSMGLRADSPLARSLLILGDNALRGKPFAYQRDFSLNVAPQRTVTVSKTCVYTYTEKPTTTLTCTPPAPCNLTNTR